MTTAMWTADVVLADLLDPIAKAGLIKVAERETRDDLRGEFGAAFAAEGPWGPVTFKYDRRNGRRHLHLHLVMADGVTYTSRHDRSYSTCGWGSDKVGNTDVIFEAAITVTGLALPDTVLSALVGRHAQAVIGHPALRDPRLVITATGRNGKPGEWTGFYAHLETVEVELNPQG